jgi:hydroxyethylthiazole kinase-like uncharacterized protein yjeF
MAPSLIDNPHSGDLLYSGEQVRELDRRAIVDEGISGALLMKRAGRAAFEHACRAWPGNRCWVVVCGAGNNAGDAYVFAALAAQKQHAVILYYLCEPTQLKGDAKTAADYARQESVPMQPFQTSLQVSEGAVLVDGLLGTGLRGSVRPEYAAAIDWINKAGSPVLALDLPSGLCVNTGAELGCAVRAQHTVTFIGNKLGLLTGRGPALAGQITLADLQVPQQVYENLPPVARRVRLPQLLDLVPQREADAHKGQFGHVMVIGGEQGFGGAAILAAEAAAVSGAGLVSLATRSEHVTAALVRRPELMVVGVASGQELEPHLTRPTLLVVGPGLGRTPWSEQMLQQALKSNLPLVLDADALNILAEGRLTLPKHGQWVLTPHPGEAGRLLGISTAEVQQNRLQAVLRLQQKYGGIVLLKGAGTLITKGAETLLAKVGNPGLATAGSGDVLSGLIGSLMAQGLAPLDAAQLGVCLHGDAGDLAVEETGVAGLLAAELLPYIRELLKP